MSVKVKDVGSFKIHVKETTIQKWWVILLFAALMIFGGLLIRYSPNAPDIYGEIMGLTGFGVFLAFACLTVLSIINKFVHNGNDFLFKCMTTPAYYVDTTMYGIGGKTIRKTTPEQDHIAICKASHEFEMQILERIKKEEELKAIVGDCK